MEGQARLLREIHATPAVFGLPDLRVSLREDPFLRAAAAIPLHRVQRVTHPSMDLKPVMQSFPKRLLAGY